MNANTEKRLDGWAGSYDWRDALANGEITEAALLAQLDDLERRYGEEDNRQ